MKRSIDVNKGLAVEQFKEIDSNFFETYPTEYFEDKLLDILFKMSNVEDYKKKLIL